MVFPVGAEHYELIICHFSRSTPVKLSVNVYKSDSEDHTMRSNIFERAIKPKYYRGRIFDYNNGVLYLPNPIFEDIKVLQLNIKNGAMNEITVGRKTGSNMYLYH